MRGMGQWASGPESWGLSRNPPRKINITTQYAMYIMTAKTLLQKKLFLCFSLKKKHDPQYSIWHNWHNLIDSCNFPAGCTLDYDYRLSLRVQRGSGWLLCRAPTSYIGSREEAMFYRVRIRDPLLMLEADRKECRTESESHEGRVVCRRHNSFNMN